MADDKAKDAADDIRMSQSTLARVTGFGDAGVDPAYVPDREVFDSYTHQQIWDLVREPLQPGVIGQLAAHWKARGENLTELLDTFVAGVKREFAEWDGAFVAAAQDSTDAFLHTMADNESTLIAVHRLMSMNADAAQTVKSAIPPVPPAYQPNGDRPTEVAEGGLASFLYNKEVAKITADVRDTMNTVYNTTLPASGDSVPRFVPPPPGPGDQAGTDGTAPPNGESGGSGADAPKVGSDAGGVEESGGSEGSDTNRSERGAQPAGEPSAAGEDSAQTQTAGAGPAPAPGAPPATAAPVNTYDSSRAAPTTGGAAGFLPGTRVPSSSPGGGGSRGGYSSSGAPGGYSRGVSGGSASGGGAAGGGAASSGRAPGSGSAVPGSGTARPSAPLPAPTGSATAAGGSASAAGGAAATGRAPMMGGMAAGGRGQGDQGGEKGSPEYLRRQAVEFEDNPLTMPQTIGAHDDAEPPMPGENQATGRDDRRG